MPERLARRVAIVTGGGHGIGKAYCHGLAAAGAVVFVASPESDFITSQTLVVDGGAVLH